MIQLKKLPILMVLSLGLIIPFGASLLAQTGFDPTPDYRISLCDYEQPETTYQNFDLAVDYHFYDDPLESNEGNINRGNGSGNYDFIYSTTDYSYNISSNFNLSISDSSVNYDAYGTGRYNLYITPSDFFAFGGASVDVSDNFSELAGVRVSTGTGYGRFKNVTPLVRSALIDQMLVDRGAISENLPAEIVKRMGELIGGMGPETEVETIVDEIVSIIESEVVPEENDLGAVETLRIREIIEKGLRPSLCGWEVRGGLSYEILDPQGEERDILLNAAARYARPFTPYSQLVLEADLSSTFEINYAVNALANYTYRFNENFDTDFQYSYYYQQGKVDYFYQQSFTATGEIQLRQNLGMSVSLGLSDSTNFEEMAKEITVGFSFNLI